MRYVFAPKERVMYDIVNRAQNITLPVVAVDVTNIQRDPSRVFNKQDSFHHNTTQNNTPGSITQYRTPVPVQISVSLSILAGYQLDLEQIASNFMAYFNPYVILATKVPTDLGPEYDLEVRTKATWDGSLGIQTPTNTTYADKFRRVGEASFVLDAWIYPEAVDDLKPIYFIDANFHAIDSDIATTSSYYFLSGEMFELSSYSSGAQHRDTISLSGTPTNTNIFFSSSGQNIALDTSIIFQTPNERHILLYGHQYDFLDVVLLSSNNTSLYPASTSYESTYYGTVSGYPLSSYEVLNNNMLQITIPGTNEEGMFDIITYNQAGWSSTYEVNEFSFERVAYE